MAYIKFARNQTNAASEMMISAEGIFNIVSNSATSLIIQYNTVSMEVLEAGVKAQYLTLTLQVGATNGATLTRANIVEKVIDTIGKAGLSGPIAQVPDMEIQTAAWAGITYDATP